MCVYVCTVWSEFISGDAVMCNFSKWTVNIGGINIWRARLMEYFTVTIKSTVN